MNDQTLICTLGGHKGLPCDRSCPFRGWYFNREENRSYMSCHFAHKELPSHRDDESKEAFEATIARKE